MGSMENTEDTLNLKGGHAPAVKVGGVRMVHKDRPHPKEDPPAKPSEEEGEEFGEDEKPRKTTAAVVSGANTEEAAAFPKEAVKAYHEKPVPKHDKDTGPARPTYIHQPRN